MNFLPSTFWTIATLLLVSTNLVQADVYELKDGGQVDGALIDRGKKGEYVVKTTEGVVVTLARKQVQRVIAQDSKHLEYVKLSRSLPDTAEMHRQLIDWCKQAKLRKSADHHRKRLLELDPDDQRVRASLGYQKRNGRWLTQEEIMADRGLVRFEGAYRTSQDIALREVKNKRKLSTADWQGNIRRWRGWLDDRRSAEAIQLISEINDPFAAPALIKILENERNQQVRDLLVETLAELLHPQTVATLVDFSLNDPDRDVRLQCLDYLIKYHQPISLKPYVNKLSSRHSDNVMVNRAAEALQELGNPEAISPLIDALITSHIYKNSGAPPGNTNVSFPGDGSGGGGLSMNNAPKNIKYAHNNLDVRKALVELSGAMDFEYDQKAWRRWYVNQQVKEFVDTRRDK